MNTPSPADKIKRQMERFGLLDTPELSSRILFVMSQSVLDEILTQFEIVSTITFLHDNSPFYILNVDGKRITVVRPGIGPQTIQFAEEAYALGAREFVLYGSCGKMIKDESDSQFYLIDSALAGDTCSAYYRGSENPGVTISPNQSLNERLYLDLSPGIKLKRSTCWTTFGFYMQSDQLRQNAIKEGAVCVDGETAPMFAFSNYHQVKCGVVLYWSDVVVPNEPYKYRDLQKDKPEFQEVREVGLRLVKIVASL